MNQITKLFGINMVVRARWAIQKRIEEDRIVKRVAIWRPESTEQKERPRRRRRDTVSRFETQRHYKREP